MMSDEISRGTGLRVCLIVSGSIACYKACALASALVREGNEVRVVATEAALRFVGQASFEGITDRKVHSSMWEPRESKTHVALRKWADLFIFYPATANRVNALAAGLADGLVGATFLANNFEKPFWIAPAANAGMISHPATVSSLERLEGWGCRIVRGEAGRLACGDVGPGRLAEPEAVASLVRSFCRDQIRKRRRVGRKVLVTGGAMTVDLDAVRSIVNSSTGRTAAAVVRAFLDAGWEVSFLAHDTACAEGCEGARIERYRGFGDFTESLGRLAGEGIDAVIHAAAVSDYRAIVPTAADGKMECDAARSVRLEPNQKLLPLIKDMAARGGRREPFVVGFKLTAGEDEASALPRAARMLEGGAVDRIVWNDVTTMTGERHPFVVFGVDSDGVKVAARGGTNGELAFALLQTVEAAMEGREP